MKIHPSKAKIFSNQKPGKQKEITIDNIKIEILQKSESARYLGQKVTAEEQETTEIKNRLKSAWAAFHKYRQELTSRSYRSCYRLRLFNMVITPTLTYAGGTWTLSKEHERMIKSAQRRMLRLIVQTKRRYKVKTKKEKEKDERPADDEEKPKDGELHCVTDAETEEGSKQSSNCDQDRDVSFHEDTDEEIEKGEIEEEDWVEYIKRSIKRSRRTHDENKDTVLDRGSLKDEVENGAENRIAPPGALDK